LGFPADTIERIEVVAARRTHRLLQLKTGHPPKAGAEAGN
jgi:hypothetical protein